MQLCGLAIIALTVTCSAQETWQITRRINGGPEKSEPVVFVREGDVVSLECRSIPNGKVAPLVGGGLQWREIMPRLRPYDNTRGTPEPVEYRAGRKLGAGATVDLRFGPHQHGAHYYTVSTGTATGPIAELISGRFKTAEPLQRAFPGRVVQVVCRPGDSYLGYLHELMGTPFIMGPGVTVSGFHQTDQRVGSDCASFAIYGRRRQGLPVLYCGPSGIVHYLKEIVAGELLPGIDGVYHSLHGNAVSTGTDGLRPGDILHFGPQVAIFYQDRGVVGKLDAADLVLESWGNTPHVTTIRHCGFYQFPVRVMRWQGR